MRPERNRIVEPSEWQEPLCKFGPGGEFVAAWQPRLAEDSALLNPLTRLLAAAVEIAAVVLGLRRTSAFVQFGNISRAEEPADNHTEKIRNAIEHSRTFGATDPPAAPVIKDGRRFSRESLLFPDVRRNGRRAEDKPKHHIRAYRGAAKKGAAVRLFKQGTLFDAQPGSVQIA